MCTPGRDGRPDSTRICLLSTVDSVNGRPRILFLCARHPYPPWRGDQVRAYHLIRCLSEHAEVRLVCFGKGSEPFPVPDVEVRRVQPSILGRIRANVSRPAPALPLQVRAFLDQRMLRVVDEEIERWRPDVLHVTLSRMAPYMTARRPCHRHLDLVDSMGLNMRARASSSSFPARTAFAIESSLVGRYEARVARGADSVSVVAQLDRREAGLDRAVVVPNGVDAGAFPYNEPDVRPPVAIFFGNLGYFHNVEPATFLATRVIERVHRDHRDARLQLAGARPGAAIRRLARRDYVDLVADPPTMAPMLHGAAVAAIPMFSGSGMKNKVLEAFCAGTPVVANAAGIEGIGEAVPGEHFLLVEGAGDMAAAISDLIGDPARRVRLARAARAMVVDSYSWERRADRMMAIYGLSPSIAG